MSVNRLAYSSEKVGLVKQLLLNAAETGKPIEYEIRVDSIRVIPRTNDPNQFDKHEDFIDGDTDTLTILVYEGTSRNNTKHIFQFKEDPRTVKNEEALSGTEVDKRVAEKMDEFKKQMEKEQLIKDNKELEKDLKEANAEITRLKETILTMENKKGLDSINIGKLVGAVGETIIRNNPRLLAKLPGGEALAGLIKEDNANKLAASSEESEVTFTRKSDDAQELSEEQIRYVKILRRFEEELEEEQLQEAIEIVELLVNNPEGIKPTYSFVQSHTTEAPKSKEGEQKESGITEAEIIE